MTSNDFWGGAAFGLCVGFLIGVLLGRVATLDDHEKPAIAAGVARYHPDTGRFEYLPPITKGDTR